MELEGLTSEERDLLGRVRRWAAERKPEAAGAIMELVNIPSIARPGEGGYAFGPACAKALERALSMAEEMGLETQNDGYACGSALYRGSTPDELAIVGHLDVVPAEDFGRFEPFRAVYRENSVIGRGAADNKGSVITALYTARCLREMGVRLRHTVRVLMGCGEELGSMDDMRHFLKRHRPPDFSLVCDSSFPFHHGEKGILTADLTASIEGSNLLDFSGGTASNSVPDHARARVRAGEEELRALAEKTRGVAVRALGNGEAEVTARGVAGHAAFPEGTVNALQRLAAFLASSGQLDETGARAMRLISRAFADSYGGGLGIGRADDVFGPNTHCGGMARVERGILRQNINIRYGLAASGEELLREICGVCAEFGFRVENARDDPPFYLPMEHPALPMLLGTCRAVLGRPDLEPFVMGGGTHARRLPNAVGYGPGIRGEKPRFGEPHGPEESFDMQIFENGVAVYVISLLRLDRMAALGGES